METIKYLGTLTKSCWSYAVDASAAFFVFISFFNYILQGSISEVTKILAESIPVITALLFICPWLFLIFFMSRKTASNWRPYKRWIWIVFHLLGLLFSCYLISITEMRPNLPLSYWIYKGKVGWIIVVILSILALIIIVTGKDVINHKTQYFIE
jgi:hypothetical protein